MKKHKVTTHHWFNGRLHVVENWFSSLEAALGFVQTSPSEHIKVHDEDDQLVHAKTSGVSQTYA